MGGLKRLKSPLRLPPFLTLGFWWNGRLPLAPLGRLQVALEDFTDGAGHGVAGEIAEGDPPLIGLWGDFLPVGLVEVKGDAVAGDAVAVLGEFREGGGFRSGAEGEVPEAFAAGALFLSEEDLGWGAVFGLIGVRTEGPEGVFGDFSDGSFGFFDREGFGVGGLAKVAGGAGEAGWFDEAAGRLAELHQGGVEASCVLRIDEGFGALPEELLPGGGVDCGGVVEETGEDAGDVGVDDRGGGVEGKRCDCSGGVGADAGEFFQFGCGFWKLAMVIGEDGAGRFLEITDTVVVAEAFPGSQKLTFRSVGDGLEVRELLEEELEAPVGEHGTDGGLLEHDLAHENGPGVAGFAPGVAFAILIKPGEQGLAEGGGFNEGRKLASGFDHTAELAFPPEMSGLGGGRLRLFAELEPSRSGWVFRVR